MSNRRWTEASTRHLMARAVGPGGKIGHEQHVTATVQARYTAKREKFDGIWFGSQAELRRYKDLKLMESGGAIADLKVHPRYDLHVLGRTLGFVELDFEYLDRAGRRIHEDVKSKTKNTSTRTAIYRWKARHLGVEHGIVITEIM